MIDLAQGLIVRGNVREPILKWAVWQKTPFGMCETLEEAIFTVQSAELNPHLTIEPKPVAFSQSLHEVYDH